jgi:hypothetical protein
VLWLSAIIPGALAMGIALVMARRRRRA